MAHDAFTKCLSEINKGYLEGCDLPYTSAGLEGADKLAGIEREGSVY